MAAARSGCCFWARMATAMAMIQATAMSMRPMLRFFIGFIFSSPSTAHRTFPKQQHAHVLWTWSISWERMSRSSSFMAGLMCIMVWGISTTVSPRSPSR